MLTKGREDLPSRDRAFRLAALRLRGDGLSREVCALRPAGTRTRQEPVSGGPCDDGATMNRRGTIQSAAAARSQETGGPGQVVVVGAGPAGLTAAYELAKRGATCTVLEMDTVVGGHLPHRGTGGLEIRHGWAPFLHKGARGREPVARDPRTGRLPVEAQAEQDLLRGDLLQLPDPDRKRPKRPRSARVDKVRPFVPVGEGCILRRISTRSKAGLRGPSGGVSTGSSSRPTPRRCGGYRQDEIKADWAAQRIKSLTLGMCQERLVPAADKTRITSLIEEFHYPRLGPGMMWERTRELVEDRGLQGGAGHPARVDPPLWGSGNGSGDRNRSRRRRLARRWPPGSPSPTTSWPFDHLISSMALV